jgi:hypothetical protein
MIGFIGWLQATLGGWILTRLVVGLVR